MKRNVPLFTKALIFLLIAAALLWQLARNAQGMTDESRIGADRNGAGGSARIAGDAGSVLPAEVLTQGKPVLLNVRHWCPRPAAPSIST